MSAPTHSYEALLNELLSMHRGRVNNVHPGTYHDVQHRRTLFSGCECGWVGSERIADDYDAAVPMPCPTVRKIEEFRALARPAIVDAAKRRLATEVEL